VGSQIGTSGTKIFSEKPLEKKKGKRVRILVEEISRKPKRQIPGKERKARVKYISSQVFSLEKKKGPRDGAQIMVLRQSPEGLGHRRRGNQRREGRKARVSEGSKFGEGGSPGGEVRKGMKDSRRDPEGYLSERLWGQECARGVRKI